MIENNISENDIQRMQRTARKRARRLGASYLDDLEAVSEDLAQEGWVGFLTAACAGKEEMYCWLDAVTWMTLAYHQWRYEYRRTVLAPGASQRIPLQNIDLSPLVSMDPNVEDIVLGCEIWDRFNRAFKRKWKRDKTEELFQQMVLNGSPFMTKGQSRRAGMSGTQNRDRRQRIRKIYEQLNLH